MAALTAFLLDRHNIVVEQCAGICWSHRAAYTTAISIPAMG
jgi:hypothetical protein